MEQGVVGDPLGDIVERAHGQARRLGHGRGGVAHFAVVLAESDPTAFDRYFGVSARVLLTQQLASFDPGTADLDKLVASIRAHEDYATDPRKVAFAAIRGTVEALLGRATEPLTLPTEIGEHLDLVETDRPGIGHDDVVDEVIARLGRLRPVPVLLTAGPGQGKTAVLRSLAARLTDAGYLGPLAGATVVRLAAEDLLAEDPEAPLEEIVRVLGRVGRPVVIAVDDLEVAAWLDAPGQANLRLLRQLRAEVARGDLPIMMLMDGAYTERLAVHCPELADELAEITVPEPDPLEVAKVAVAMADEVAEFHGVSIPVEVRQLAARPRQRTDRTEHPGLLRRRLDGAAARARLRGATKVSAADLALESISDGPFDAEGLIERLTTKVLHQDRHIRQVVERLALTRRRFDLQPHRPDGVFFLSGPSGVGKTALARALAAELHGHERNLIVLDMSEYGPEWAVSRLTGPQPGYVGSREPDAWLTTRVRNRPDSIIVFDEIDKAHPAVLDTLLQIFDGGRLTDSRGLTADFARTIVFLTSNGGAEEMVEAEVGFSPPYDLDDDDERAQRRKAALTAATRHLRKELVGRFDLKVAFDPLDDDARHAIARSLCDQARQHLAGHGYHLEISDDLVALVVDQTDDTDSGARALQRTVERALLHPLAALPAGAYRGARSGDGVAWHPA